MKNGPTPEEIMARLKERFAVECETADPASLNAGLPQLKAAADRHMEFVNQPKRSR
jgi:hypothetical protein